MVSFRLLSISLVGLHSSLSIAAPQPVPAPKPSPDPFFSPIGGIADGVKDKLADFASKLANTKPTATPSSIEDAVSTLKAIFGPKPTGLVTNGLKFLTSGLQVEGTEGVTIDNPAPPGNINSFQNTNPAPPQAIFPKANPQDPLFTKTEEELRSAIFMPATFQAADKTSPPVLLVPGTGAFGGVNFEGNMIKILAQNRSLGQAAWLNIPGAMLDDVQTNAEFVAYGVNYVAGVTGGAPISVVGWSQGNLATQWALQYWPSVRAATRQLVAFSPDFHGTVIANLADLPLIDKIPLPPAILQQQSNSALVKTLRAAGGDSAYVPTTTLYSAVFDEVVQPQAGTAASAFLRDARGVGVSNNEIQSVCPGTPAGDFGTHESLLFNGLATALAADALGHGGPADPWRIDLAAVCQQLAHPALDVKDVTQTEGLIPLAALNVLEFQPGVTKEPKIRAYA